MRALLRRFPECRKAQLGAEKDAGQVDRAEPSPFGKAGGFDILAEKQPAVVDQDVELAETADGSGDGAVPILLARHVETDVESCIPKRASGLAAAFVEHIADRNLGAGLDHQSRRLAAKASCCPGYEGYLAV
jgi:hypothetical protein